MLFNVYFRWLCFGFGNENSSIEEGTFNYEKTSSLFEDGHLGTEKRKNTFKSIGLSSWNIQILMSFVKLCFFICFTIFRKIVFLFPFSDFLWCLFRFSETLLYLFLLFNDILWCFIRFFRCILVVFCRGCVLVGNKLLVSGKMSRGFVGKKGEIACLVVHKLYFDLFKKNSLAIKSDFNQQHFYSKFKQEWKDL